MVVNHIYCRLETEKLRVLISNSPLIPFLIPKPSPFEGRFGREEEEAWFCFLLLVFFIPDDAQRLLQAMLRRSIGCQGTNPAGLHSRAGTLPVVCNAEIFLRGSEMVRKDVGLHADK